jgi:hypothetical protein
MEEITNGNVPDLYTFTISVPNTVTAATDRVHIEFDIQNTNGKTVTLYTESNKIGEVHTTYAIGLSSLNGLTESTQNFATGTSGTDFGISSAGSTHTFNLPTASASNRGALSSADWSTFNGKQNNIGLTTVGNNLATLTNPNAISFIRINADNTVTARTPAQVLTDLGVASTIILARDNAAYSLSASTTNTLVWSIAIAANTLQANDFIEWFSQMNTNAANGVQVNYRFYINTSASLTGASLLAMFTNSVATGNTTFQRNVFVTASGVSGNLRVYNNSSSSPSSYGLTSGNAANVTVDTTVIQHLIIAIQHQTTAPTSSVQSTLIRVTR